MLRFSLSLSRSLSECSLFGTRAPLQQLRFYLGGLNIWPIRTSSLLSFPAIQVPSPPSTDFHPATLVAGLRFLGERDGEGPTMSTLGASFLSQHYVEHPWAVKRQIIFAWANVTTQRTDRERADRRASDPLSCAHPSSVNYVPAPCALLVCRRCSSLYIR